MDIEHLLSGILYPEWENDIASHIEALGVTLRLPESVFDFEYESLDVIQRNVEQQWLQRDFTELRAVLFSPLLAYVGEIVRRKVSGTWEIEEDQASGCLVPWIIDEENRRYDLLRVLRPFYNDVTLSSFSGIAMAIVALPE